MKKKKQPASKKFDLSEGTAIALSVLLIVVAMGAAIWAVSWVLDFFFPDLF
ncbi:MAG: hypothetical protein R3211_07730 [Balneolaceae bacterium]|nr:hypothetical protein [Balneolaceae bacterium]